MDLKNLSRVQEGKVVINDDDLDVKSSQFEKLNKKRRINDSVFPDTASEKKKWLDSQKESLRNGLALSSSEYQYLSDSLDFIYKQLNSKIVQLKDSLGMFKASSLKDSERLNSQKEKLQELQNKLADSADKVKELRSRLSDSVLNRKELIKDLNSSKESLKSATDTIKKLSDDAQYVLETKEAADKKNAEQQKQIEELQKQLEDQKKRDQERTISVKDSYNAENTAQFAKHFESFIQTGSVFEIRAAKRIAEEIGDEKLIELVRRVEDYEPLDQATYEDLTEDLKSALSEYNQGIPSLALIQDCAYVESMKAGSQLPLSPEDFNNLLNEVSLALHTVTDKAVQEIASCIANWQPANQLLQNPTPETFENVVRAANAVCPECVVNEGSPVLPTPSCGHCESYNTVTPLTNEEYLTIYDSTESFNRVLRVASRFKIFDAVEGTVAKSECGNYIVYEKAGIKLIFYPIGDIDEVIDFMKSDDGDFSKVVFYGTFVDVAKDMGEVSLLTDSVLYKRHLADKYFISDAISAKDAKDLVNKVVTISGVKAAKEVLNSLGDNTVKFSLVASEGDYYPNEHDLLDIRVDESLDLLSDDGRYHLRLLKEKKK